MSEYIIRQCIQLDSPDLIVKVFVFLDVHPSIAINILKANITHTAALYALYKYYQVAKECKYINDTTIVEVYSYAYIGSLLKELSGMDYQCKTLGLLIDNLIFNTPVQISPQLLRRIKKNDYSGFKEYFAKIKHEANVMTLIEELKIGQIYRFKIIRRLENHYLLFLQEIDYYALLPFELTKDIVPDIPKYNTYLNASISHIDKTRKLLYVYQGNIPEDYNQPPLLSVGKIVEIRYKFIGSKYRPYILNYTKLINIDIQNKQAITNFKNKYRARVTETISYFKYEVEIIF